MKRSILIISATLLLIASAQTRLSAQSADTLKRQLQVETSEELKLSEEKALPIGLKLPKAQVPQLPAFQPSQLLSEEILTASPLALLSPLSSLMPGSQDLGYVRLAAGIKYNAQLSAGLRPWRTENKVLDLYFDGYYTDYRQDTRRASASTDDRTREHAYSLGARYTALLARDHSLDVQALYRGGRHNYNAHPTEELSRHAFSLSGNLDNVRSKEALWHYRLTPSLSYTTWQGLRDLNLSAQSAHQTLSPREVRLSMEGMLAYQLSEAMSVGGEVSTSAVFYRGDNYTNQLMAGLSPLTLNAFSPLSVFSLRPFWRINLEDKLSLRLGLRLDNYTWEDVAMGSGRRQSKLRLMPDLSLGWQFAPTWRTDVSLSSRLSENALSALFQKMPYIALQYGGTPTYSPWLINLSLSGLILPELSVRAYAEYELYEGAINFLAKESRDSSPVIYTPQQADGEHALLGLGLKYRFAQRLSISVDGRMHHWSRELYGRPKLELETGLVYKPHDKLQMNASYQLFYGISQQVFQQALWGGTKRAEAMRTYALLRFGASYEVAPRWSVSLSGHLVPDGSSTLYYGYTPQRISALLGLSYRF